MKRSEMVKELRKLVFLYTDDLGELTELDASNLLREIENLGMLPPLNERLYYQEAVVNYKEGVDVHVWEPESGPKER